MGRVEIPEYIGKSGYATHSIFTRIIFFLSFCYRVMNNAVANVDAKSGKYQLA